MPPSERMSALRLLHVRGLAHEGERDVVDAVLDAEREVAAVLLGERGRGEAARRAGSCPCSASAGRRARPRPRRSRPASRPRAAPGSRRRAGCGRRAARPSAAGRRWSRCSSASPSIVSSVVIRMRAPATSSTGPPPLSRPVRILGPDRSCRMAIGPAPALGDLAHGVDHGQVVLVLAVREVEAYDVHACLDQPLQHARARGRPAPWWRRSSCAAFRASIAPACDDGKSSVLD